MHVGMCNSKNVAGGSGSNLGFGWFYAFLVVLCALSGSACAPEDTEPWQGPTSCRGVGDNGSVSFARDVQPLLAKYCIGCHGADERSRAAGLRLDTSEGVFQPRPGGGKPVIVKGNADASLFIERLKAAEAQRMPPVVTQLAVSPDELAVFGCWVDSGAEFPESWAFTTPLRPTLPAVDDSSFGRNAIDAFILAALEAQGLRPASEARPYELLRRLSFDLRGLPPSIEELEAFTGDPSDAAYVALVDKMLAEPEFGEHRARYWLDAVRYADTHGFSPDNYRSIWPYRDYVIAAFNQNKPFDQFSIEQIAGDLLPDRTLETEVATGFIRNAMSTDECGVVADEYAAIYAKDRVETVSSVWLGLTTGCAACHDHKYDPISQKDFYALTAYFRNSTQPIRDEHRADAPPTILVPPSMTPTLVTEEASGEPFAHVLERGRYDAPGERVAAGVPESLPPLPIHAPNNRLGLAMWLMAREHPLTARVAANRFWAEVFGVGLVATAHDFGKAGAAPSHAELLDWLAVEFRESGWDVKHLFRLMVTSASYRQSARVTPEKLAIDPANRLLSRGPRFRMDGEMIRDLALAVSGLLVRHVGGPSVKPYQPAGVWEEVAQPDSDTARFEQDTGDALYRRSLYTFWKRAAPPPSLQIFNAPTRERSVVQRERSNTPLQALVTMNDVQFVEAARQLAARAMQSSVVPEQRLHLMAKLVLGRALRAEELDIMNGALEKLLERYEGSPEAASLLTRVGEYPKPEALREPELAAWTMVASSFFNLDEALNQ